MSTNNVDGVANLQKKGSNANGENSNFSSTPNLVTA